MLYMMSVNILGMFDILDLFGWKVIFDFQFTLFILFLFTKKIPKLKFGLNKRKSLGTLKFIKMFLLFLFRNFVFISGLGVSLFYLGLYYGFCNLQVFGVRGWRE